MFRPLDDAGELAVVSRIKQIGDSLRYCNDPDMASRLVPLVDRMLDSCPSLSRVVYNCNIPVGLPTWLGGLGHPVGDEPGYILSVQQEYRDFLVFLRDCSLENLVELLLLSDFLSSERVVINRAIIAMVAGCEVLDESDVDGVDWISIENLTIVREPGEKYSSFQNRKRLIAQQRGLISLTEFCGWYQSVTTVVNRFQMKLVPDTPIAYKLRRRQREIFDSIPEQYRCMGDIIDEDVFRIYRNVCELLETRYWRKETLLPVIGFETQPSFSVSFSAIGTRP